MMHKYWTTIAVDTATWVEGSVVRRTELQRGDAAVDGRPCVEGRSIRRQSRELVKSRVGRVIRCWVRKPLTGSSESGTSGAGTSTETEIVLGRGTPRTS